MPYNLNYYHASADSSRGLSHSWTYSIKHYAMKTYGEMEVQLHHS
jgi:hypothetical protein